MGKRSPGPMSYIREASALRNIKLCYAGRSFSIRVFIRCLRSFSIRVVIRCLRIENKCKQSITIRLGAVDQSPYTEDIRFSTGGFLYGREA